MKRKVHWYNRDKSLSAIKAHCGRWYPDSLTGTPADVTCKWCIKRGFDYGGTREVKE